MPRSIVDPLPGAVPLIPLTKAMVQAWGQAIPAPWGPWVKMANFTAQAGSVCLVPDAVGQPAAFLVGLGNDDDPWVWSTLRSSLPQGVYCIDPPLADPAKAGWAALAWCLSDYAFTRYRKAPPEGAKLVWPDGVDQALTTRTAEAVTLVRDLINTPAADMGPAELAQAAQAVAVRYGAQCRVIVGEDLLTHNFPAIYAVGKGAGRGREPRLIDITWGQSDHPLITLVGKGVCFDTGGLDIKTNSSMKLMKKDMGGAAHVLGLALMVMDARLPLRLRVLIPAVENSVSGEAMRPLDILSSRKGTTIEVGNTDAEGRLILADALWEGGNDNPALMVDFATLTGAARTALGPDLPALFSNDDGVAERLLAAGRTACDPLWRLPLHKPYRRMLDSKVADICNASDSSYAGAITAALFLQEFVPAAVPWAHLDILGWNPAAKPGRPDGGEAMGLRAIYNVLADHYVTI